MRRHAMLTMDHARVVALLLVFGISGCAIPVREQVAKLNVKPTCCASFRDLPFQPLMVPEKRSVQLNDLSPVYVFESGKSYFAAFRLPVWSAPIQIRIESKQSTAQGGFLSPSALLMDENHRVTRQFNVGSDVRPGERVDTLHLFINDVDQHERYIVIFSAKPFDSAAHDQVIATPTMVMVGAVALQVGATEARARLTYAPAGMMDMTVSLYRPVVVGEPDKRQ